MDRDDWSRGGLTSSSSSLPAACKPPKCPASFAAVDPGTNLPSESRPGAWSAVPSIWRQVSANEHVEELWIVTYLLIDLSVGVKTSQVAGLLGCLRAHGEGSVLVAAWGSVLLA